MVIIRKASAYSKKKPVVYTRKSKITQKSYVKMVPPQKIVKFNMGDIKGFDQGKYKLVLSLNMGEDIQIRDMALEAVRQSLNKDLTVLLQTSFFLRCNVYPHNILRNNRVFSGGSKGERIQTGMQLSFGTPEGRAATVKKGRPVFTAHFNGEENIPKIREFFSKVRPKLPGHIIVGFQRMK